MLMCTYVIEYMSVSLCGMDQDPLETASPELLSHFYLRCVNFGMIDLFSAD